MTRIALTTLLFAGCCCSQELAGFHPAGTNVPGAEYLRVDASSRVELRVKAPDATKVKVNFWSGPKLDLDKQADGFWTLTAPALPPGLRRADQ